MFRKNCLLCFKDKLKTIINLGLHPFADKFLKKVDLENKEPTYPLLVDLCSYCQNIQLKYVTSPEHRYQKFDYSYTSSTSKTSRDYWKKLNIFINKITNQGRKKILEIGSNDGYLLSLLKKKHFCLGIDASPKMAELASKKKIKTLVKIFEKKTASMIKKKYGKFDIIIANNVFNHSNNPFDFMNGVKSILSNEGMFVTENPYWKKTIASGFFDQIYHEHTIYINVQSMYKLCKRLKIYIYDILETENHGSSLRFIIGNKINLENTKKIKKFINQEKRSNIFSTKYYKELFQRIEFNKNKFLIKLHKLKLKKKKIVCIGASAKGNTFLNFYGLNYSLIDFITDVSANKVNKYTPFSRIKIKKDINIKNIKNLYLIITAWNFSDHIVKKLKKINDKFVVLKPFNY